jgi:hypothetical protein
MLATEGNPFPGNFWIGLPSDAASFPRRMEFTAPPL